jgi:hypothetical protein
MKYSPIVAIILSSAFLSAGCSPSKSAHAAKPEMTRCQEEMNTIPEVAAASIKARSKRPDDREDSVEGMEIAITINRMVRTKIEPDRDQDDWCYTENTAENFHKLVNALKENAIPPTVNFVAGDSVDQPLQEEWLRSSNLIGSLNYAGRSVKKRTAQEFISDWGKNEEALAPLWRKFERKQKYVRFPGLKLGMDEQRPREIRAFLKQSGYIEVPATIDSRDDYFSQPYCAALARGDKICANFIAATFKSLLLDRTIKARLAAVKIAGRDVKQILMIQANQLTCDLLDELLHWYKAMGVRFISLEEALRDPFYASEEVTNKANQIIRETKRAQLGVPPAEE